MLERIEHDNGLVTYQSRRLRAAGVKHGFTTRRGGASEGAYASLNMDVLIKGAATDKNIHVSENFRRVRAALGAERLPRAEVHQVHGDAVWEPPVKPVRFCHAPQADAMVSRDPKMLLCIRVADCVPVLLATSDGRAVAAVHAGWRGVVAGVVPRAVERLAGLAESAAGDVIAAVGPCIGREHFEVGQEVAEQFDAAFVTQPAGKPHIDLAAAVAAQLQRVGVAGVDVAHVCTYANEDDFFSHRRDVTHRGAERTGRMAALIAAHDTAQQVA